MTATTSLVAGALAFSLVACGGSVPETAHAQPRVDDASAALALAREEKLARDVYRTLGRRYPLPIFAHIAEAEQRHFDAVAASLPTETREALAALPEGRFGDAEVDALFAELVTQGEANELAALAVGLRIEEMDLADLAHHEAALDPDVVAHLARGSRNHLRAFFRQHEARGGSYVARHLTQDELEAIARSEHERGGGRGRGHGGGRGRGHGGGHGQGGGECRHGD
ncbi:MAG: DUF2202 domain-containing protein [Sandaracinus sp.]|nr:DUF2202 domain-containing protein [Sandaracinus sp.]